MQAKAELLVVEKFDGDYAFLSNFYIGDPIIYKTQLFQTAEHLYQSLKTEDPYEAAWVASAATPGQAKRRGQEITVKAGWDTTGLKVLAMRTTVGQKFLQDRHLQRKLLATGNAALVEGNHWHDNYWGKCTCGSPECVDRGMNILGCILEELRSDLRKWS